MLAVLFFDNRVVDVYDAVGNRTKMTSTNVAAYRADSTTAVLFHLDEPEDSEEVTDSSGHGLTGDVSGSVHLGVEGRFSKAADFDGLSGSEIKVSDDPELEVGSGEFTLEAWIKPDVDALGTDIMAIASKWCEVEGSEARSYLLRVNADGKLEGKVYGSGDETATIVSDESLSEALTDKEWVHVAMERNADDELSLWVDRVKQEDTATFTATVADENEAFRIGATGNVEEGEEADGMYFVGLIDEVRLSKTARGAAGKLCFVQIDYTYNARNQLVTGTSGASTKTYSYDKNGNTTDIVEKVGTVEVASVTMAYDALNRMTSYTGPEGSESFGYRGAEWHRFSADGTSFLYDGDNVLADISTGIDRLYVTPFLDQNLSVTIAAGDDAGTYYYSQDGLGSVRTLTDSTGSLKNRYDYLPFGGPHAPGTSVMLRQRYAFTGREKNPVSPLMYYRYRQYVLETASFESRDPTATERRLARPHAHYGSWLRHQVPRSLYGYCRSSPITLRDPYGLFWRGHTGNEHENLTRLACGTVDICDKKCCDLIVAGNLAVDSPVSGHRGDSHKHFMYHSLRDGTWDLMLTDPRDIEFDEKLRNQAKQAALNWVKGEFAKGCELAKKGQCRQALIHLGHALHTEQDRFSHSMWKEGQIPIDDTEHSLTHPDDPQRNNYIQAAKNAYNATKAMMGRFKNECIGCCCSFPRVPGQPAGTKSLCEDE